MSTGATRHASAITAIVLVFTSASLLPGFNGLRLNRRSNLPVLYCWLDLEPDGIQRRQEHQRQNRSPEGSTDQRVRQRPPENRMRQRNEGQHGGERRQDDWTGALHGGFDHRIKWRQSILLVAADLTDQD